MRIFVLPPVSLHLCNIRICIAEAFNEVTRYWSSLSLVKVWVPLTSFHSRTAENMHCWLLFFAGATVYGMSRISEPQIKAVNFAHPIHGRKLTGSMIREILVNSEESCSFECVKEEKCISYNLKSSPNETDGFKCQISTSDRFVSVTNFTNDEKFKYVGMQVSSGNNFYPF